MHAVSAGCMKSWKGAGDISRSSEPRTEGLFRRKTMQKIINLNKRSVIAIALCMTFLLGYMPFSTDRAYAADGSITLKVGRDIEYSLHHTHYFYAGDKESPV